MRFDQIAQKFRLGIDFFYVTLTAFAFAVFAYTASAQTFSSTDTPLDIPIGAPGVTSGTTTSTITVTGGAVQDVNVVMDFDHTFFGDLDVDITSPSGTTVRLFQDQGGAGDPTGTYTFDDEAAVAFTGQTPGGTFSPEEALAAFDGEDATGDWILTIVDDAGGDVGTLNFWELVFIFGVLDNFLDDQQASLSPFNINQSTGDLINGVTGNVNSVFGGSSFGLSASDSSFSLQSRSIARQQLVGAAYKKLQQLRSGARNAASLDERLGIGAENFSANATYGADASLDEASQLANSKLNLWARGTYSDFDGDNTSFEGQISNINGGIDYRLADNLLIGVLLGYGDADFDTVTNGIAGTFDSSGFTVGGYLGWQVVPDVTFDALFAYSDLDYDNTSGATVGSFDADRWTFAANLQGRMKYGDITILPTVNFHYVVEDQDAYTDSAAILQPARDIEAGRIAAGPVIQFPVVDTSVGSAQGWIAVKGEYDFSDQNAILNTTLPDFSDTFSARLQAGANFVGDNGATLGFQVDVSGVGASEFDGVGGSLELKVPF